VVGGPDPAHVALARKLGLDADGSADIFPLIAAELRRRNWPERWKHKTDDDYEDPAMERNGYIKPPRTRAWESRHARADAVCELIAAHEEEFASLLREKRSNRGLPEEETEE